MTNGENKNEGGFFPFLRAACLQPRHVERYN